MSCQVCYELFNRSSRAQTKCPYCPFSACTGCSERYLLETTQDAHCMSCRKAWNREILVDNFSKKFISQTYKNRRESLLLEREKSLLPATQPYVELELKIRDNASKISRLSNLVDQHTRKMYEIANLPIGPFAVKHGMDNDFDAYVLRHKLAQEERKAISEVAIDIQHLEWYQGQLAGRLYGNRVEFEKRQFVRACPVDDCRGFLSTAWKCGMCDNWTCPDCHEVIGKDKEADHTCDPNNVETAKLLARDSRNCPKCAAMIFKIDGCDQMYCTQCHTAFSWRTGHIETGRIHNPHYYEFHRQRGTLQREPGDIPCGGFPDWRTVLGFLPRAHIFYNRFANAHRTVDHCRWVVAPRYTVNGNQDNRDLRIKFMIGDINEEEFKKKIQQREKARQRKGEFLQVLEMYMNVLSDLFQGFVADKNCSDFAESLDELRRHFNTTMGAVSERYSKCAIPFKLGENFEML